MNADELIRRLDLRPHPEGGYYRETYRSDMVVSTPAVDQPRHAVTDIYFLLTKGQVSRFHRVLHDEIWHFYDGAPLRLLSINDSDIVETVIGCEGGEFKHVVTAGVWQAAESLGEFSLVGCTVAPGFDFADFQFLSDSSESVGVSPSFERFI